MKRIHKVVLSLVVFTCYCFGMGAANSNVAYAALSTFIMKPFYGSYYLDGNQTCGHWFRLYEADSSVDSVFRGKYPDTPFIACSSLISYDSTYSTGLASDNITLKYSKWARSKGEEGFVPEIGEKEIIGHLYNSSDTKKFRTGSSNTYIRMNTN